MQTPVCMMTGEEFLSLLQSGAANRDDCADDVNEERGCTNNLDPIVYGMKGIAEIFHCSLPKAHKIKKSGVINDAITQIGRTIMTDPKLALQLAHDHYIKTSKRL